MCVDEDTPVAATYTRSFNRLALSEYRARTRSRDRAHHYDQNDVRQKRQRGRNALERESSKINTLKNCFICSTRL